MTTGFWDGIKAQLAELRTATTADDVIAALDPPSCGDAFFAGGDGGDVMDALSDAGWHLTWSEADYYWVMQAPGGDLITYCEGDVSRGDQAVKGDA